jgi:prefoldin subunit 5
LGTSVAKDMHDLWISKELARQKEAYDFSIKDAEVALKKNKKKITSVKKDMTKEELSRAKGAKIIFDVEKFSVSSVRETLKYTCFNEDDLDAAIKEMKSEIKERYDSQMEYIEEENAKRIKEIEKSTYGNDTVEVFIHLREYQISEFWANIAVAEQRVNEINNMKTRDWDEVLNKGK